MLPGSYEPRACIARPVIVKAGSETEIAAVIGNLNTVFTSVGMPKTVHGLSARLTVFSITSFPSTIRRSGGAIFRHIKKRSLIT